MGRSVCQLAVSEMVDVHNKKVHEHRAKEKIVSRKRAPNSE